MKNISKVSDQHSKELSTCTPSIQDGNECLTDKVEKSSETSPAVSRYGRTHKPKISEDFLPTDKKVGAILGLSPKSRLSLAHDSSRSSTSPNKAVEKGRIIHELFKEERKSTRGRKPKLKLSNSSHLEKKLEEKRNESLCEKTLEVKSEVSTSEKAKDNHQTQVEVEKSNIVNKGENEVDHEIMSPDVTSSVDDNILSERLGDSLVQIKIGSDCGWVPGDLAWARVGGHPFWPCMIAVDPHSAVYTKIKRVGRGLSSVQRSLHVQFFGDNGRHSWVTTNCVIKFEGKNGLQSFAEKVLSEIKKKDKKFSSAFSIRPSSKVQWDCAVQEAEEALPKTNQERIKFFEENFPPEINDENQGTKDDANTADGEKKQSKTFKRKRNSISGDDKPRKQIKVDPESNAIKIKEEKEISERIVNASSERPKKRKRHEKKEPYDFRIFADKYSKHASEIHPGLSEENLQKLMVRMWSAMDESEKAVYKREREDSFDESSSAEEDTSDNDDRVENYNDNSSDSTRVSTPSLTFAGALVKKVSGLFRGTRQEKVCQICWKPGNTIKCRGPCLGVFHVDCYKYPTVKSECPETEIKKRGRKPKNMKSDNAIASENGGDIISDNSADKESKVEKTTNEEEKEKYNGDKENKQSTEEFESGEFRCRDCAENRMPLCFVCGSEKDPKTDSDVRIRCINGHCGKFYHLECVKAWPQASCVGSSKKQINGNKNVMATEGSATQVLTCPQHVCHTCASDDPRNATMRFNHERLVRCILCPTTYHTGNYCVPAGSEILTGSQIICPRHYEAPVKGNHHVNAAWCFICAMGGSLICCDLCPTSFHAECLHIAPPEGGYICEDCDTGRYPLYGEVVWVKLGAYRWWPAQILFPNQVPDNIENLTHKRGEFAVRFFGSHDHYWVNRGRVFLYQEGDTGHKSAKKTSVDGLFQKALTEAAEVHKKIRVDRSLREAEARPGMKPPSYVRIKANKPVGNVRVYEADLSSMTPCECDPDSKNPCGIDSDCLNRILMVECTPGVCAAGDRCGNQCFVKRQYPPLEPFRTESRGWGLRALKNLHKGEFVIEYVGEMIDEAEYRRRLDDKHKEKDENYYFLTIDNHRLLDAGPKGNVARFMNHSCQPNCETQKWTVNGDTRVGLFALQDIPKGEELTFNYNLECVGPDKKPCMCGAPNCSGYIGVKVSKLVEDDRKAKLGRQDNQKSAKRKKKRQYIKLTEAECFECGGGGELLLCDNKTCPKGFHLNCAKRKNWPEGKWLCPWHYCDVCQRRTGKRCGFCPRSYCIQHADGNIRLNSSLGMVCQKHDEELELKAVSNPYNEILEDVEMCLKGINNSNDSKDVLQDEKESKTNDSSELAEECTNIEVNPHCGELIVNSNNPSYDSVLSSPNDQATSQEIDDKPQESTSLLSNSNMSIKKKRGRPKKYPLSPPTLAHYITPKFPGKSEMKTLHFISKLEDGRVLKKKRGRKKKNPLPDSELKEIVQLNTGVQTCTEDQKTVEAEPLPENRLHSPLKHLDETTPNNASNLVFPRTSNRKRQPSEKLAAYISSQTKSAKKRKNKTLDNYVIKLETTTTTDLERNAFVKCNSSPEAIKSDKNLIRSDSELNGASYSTPIKKGRGRPKKILIRRLEKRITFKSNEDAKFNQSKKISDTSEKSYVIKSVKDSKPTKSPKKTNKMYTANMDKIFAAKSDKNSAVSDKRNASKTTKIYSTPRASKDIQPVLKSYMKKMPKKTILQRVDHKPDLSKFPLDCNQKLLAANFTENRFQPRENVLVTISSASIKVGDEQRHLFQKHGINGTSEIAVNNTLLESFDDNETQYFSENITTIPIKFSEFGQMNDEFGIENQSPSEELIETHTNLDSEFITPHSEETTEKLSEDGKYQILTNMRPDSLDIEKQGSVIMGVES
ncbi:Probable histone-lysine N-methyltransferase Mes-4 [Gryllus bimaculatus]|nr:Probable histone-lysine N-methyltransferase Mes-4 [Gryllus bimaculatus]